MNPTIISYKHLRILIGILAISITWVCIIGGMIFGQEKIATSISAYYYTNIRDILEGLLFLVGSFLICYMGYDLLDRIISTSAGIMAICISLFPCFKDSVIPIGLFQIPSNISDIIHLSTASIFFGLLSFMSIFLFTKSKNGNKKLYRIKKYPDGFKKVVNVLIEKTPEKKIRNIIYITCGIIIALSGIAIGVLMIVLGKETMDKYCMILILEAVILHAFGFSWLVKSQIIMGDKQNA